MQLSGGGKGSLIIGPLIVVYFGRRPASVAASADAVLGLVLGWGGPGVGCTPLPGGKPWFWAGKPISGVLITGPNQGHCSQRPPWTPGKVLLGPGCTGRAPREEGAGSIGCPAGV